MGLITHIIDIEIEAGEEKGPPLLVQALALVMHPPVELPGLAPKEGVSQGELGGEGGGLDRGREGGRGARVR